MHRPAHAKLGGKLIQLGVGLLCTAVLNTAQAQNWPTAKPVRIIEAGGPGSASDILMRLIGDEMRVTFSQQFLVESRPGAQGRIAAEFVAKSLPDGYTLLATGGGLASQNPVLYKTLPYDPIADFSPIGRIALLPFTLAVKGQGSFNSVADLVAYAHDPRNYVTYGYVVGTGQIGGAAFSTLMKFKATPVPYKSTAQAATDLAGGVFTFLFTDFASSQSAVKAGRIKLLAVTSEQKTQLAPELPTLAAEAKLPGFEVVTWSGLAGPAGMPRDVVQKLNAALNTALTKPEIVTRINFFGGEPFPSTPEEMMAYTKRQIEVWRTKVKEAGIEPQ